LLRRLVAEIQLKIKVFILKEKPWGVICPKPLIEKIIFSQQDKLLMRAI